MLGTFAITCTCVLAPAEFFSGARCERTRRGQVLRVAIADHIDPIVIPIAFEEPLRLADEPDRIGHRIAALDVHGRSVHSQVITEAIDIIRLGLPTLACDQDRRQPFTRRLLAREPPLLLAHLPVLGLIVPHGVNAGPCGK